VYSAAGLGKVGLVFIHGGLANRGFWDHEVSTFAAPMMKSNVQRLTGVCETALIPLFYRAVEHQSANPLILDPSAFELINRIDYDFSRFDARAPERVFAMMRAREFDRCVRAFLTEHPDATVVDIGCGLDTRFGRVNNGTMGWYGVDLPQVIEFRRELLHEDARSHLMAYSALDFGWMDRIQAEKADGCLFLAEGVFVYLDEQQVKTLVLALAERFPASELIFDTMSPLFVWLHNRRALLKRLNVRLGWGLRNPRDLECSVYSQR
jgi:O-methyltransferase involved in polyketide biosynthesis